MIYSIYKHKYPFFLGLAVFLFIFVFFAQVHPVYPYDADDWTYLYNSRDIYPSISAYNPTRVLPEILMPFAGEISMVCFYPLVGDITTSVCFASSLILALFIAAYILLFYRFLRKTIGASQSSSALFSLLFFAFHFLFFRCDISGNQHLFYSFDLCCHYNYTIPNLLASCLVFLFLTDRFEYFTLKNHILAKGFLLLSLYLCLFSHVFGSVILTAYIGSLLCFQLVHALYRKNSILDFLKRFWLHISTIGVWFVALLFEADGRRASNVSDIANVSSFGVAVKEATRDFLRMMLDQSNGTAISLILLSILIFLALTFREASLAKWRKPLGILILSLAICSIYLILMGAKSYPYYLLRSMTIFAVPFFAILSGLLCGAAIISRYHNWSIILPFVIMLVYCEIEQKGNTFLDVQTLQIKQKVQGTYSISMIEIKEQNRQNIQTLIEADRQGLERITMEVAPFDHVDNWPLAFYYGKRLSRFLYKYGIIDREIKVTTVPHKVEEVTLCDDEAR